jgi:dihydrofolate synthase/folylpolyglutamate synthase
MDCPLETYDQALQFLAERVNYERLQAGLQDLKLDRMRRFLSLLGNPQESVPAVHVAGTKGKGSVCAMVAAILSAAGLRTGLYISPHISVFEERMTVDGRRPSPRELVELLSRVRGRVAEMDLGTPPMPPTYFEIATALAWLYFLDQQAEIVVLETGIGGRLDATNVCRPLATCITNISRDHTQLLGNTLAKIATEKAGILKPGIPVVSGVAEPETIDVISAVAQERGAPLWLLGREITIRDIAAARTVDDERQLSIHVQTPHRLWRDVRVPLRGRHQADNTALALGLIDRLCRAGYAISEAAVHQGLANVVWPARVEVLLRDPTVIIDAAHNCASAMALAATLRDDFPQRRRLLIFASTKDKDVRGHLEMLLPQFNAAVLTRYSDNPRAVPPEELATIATSLSSQPVQVAADPIAAWHLCRGLATESDVIVITGSFFLVAELRGHILAEARRPAEMLI